MTRAARRRAAAVLGSLLASAAPGVLLAQPAPNLSQDRTGPSAAPPRLPAYPVPTPGLTPPAPGAGPALAPPSGGGSLREVRVVADKVRGSARPSPAWRPPVEAGANLRLEHRPGEALDEAWVRRQFELNGMPGEGASVGRALALVQLVNRAYLSAGFINSGVAVRSSASPGVLELGIVYGGLAPPAAGEPALSVDWTSGHSGGLDEKYVRDRLPSAFRRPLNAADLEREFRLLAEDPAIRTVNADLRPGSRPGEASLGLGVSPQDRFDLYLTSANNRAPSVGGERLSTGGSMRNLIAPGDLLSGEVGITDGLEDATVGYAIPFLTRQNTLSVRMGFNDAAVIDAPLLPLDISAKERTVEVGLTRKLIDAPLLPRAEGGWSPARTLSGGFLVTHRISRSYLLGEPFSFSAGSVDGKTEYTALRFVGDYLVRGVQQVFAVSVTASTGIEGSRSDLPGLDSPKEHFKVVLAQVNYARRLSDRGLEVRARVTGQYANSILYAGERFSAGGETSVRGYRENLLLADKGVVGSVELARPLSLSGRQGAAKAFDWGAFTVTAFADGAVLRNHRPPQPETAIYSVGGSLAWVPSDAISAQITYGQALKKRPQVAEEDIQDKGLYFRVTLRPLRLRF